MKALVLNFSGNTGKSTAAIHMLVPRIPGAEYVAVESINSSDDTGDGPTIRGDQFGSLQEELMMLDAAVVDVGASNIEDFMKFMTQYRGSHEDFDLFVVPVVKDAKQVKDTIATIMALSSIGVPAKKIRVVFNKTEIDEDIESSFYPLFAFHKASKTFTLKRDAAIQSTELFQKLRSHGATITQVLNDETDHKAALREARAKGDQDAALKSIAMISMRRLALDCNDNLDAVFAALTK